jgi:sialate O-acetylesterase
VWLRRIVELPPIGGSGSLMLHMGDVDDTEVTWFNGKQVGSTVKNGARVYQIPRELVRHGRNTLVLRITDNGGGGGFNGLPEHFFIQSSGTLENVRVALSGEWMMRLGADLSKLQPRPVPPGNWSRPTGLFNGMIAPLVPYAIKGTIWYQGESNASRAWRYRELFPAMIEDWRQLWAQGEFPFLYVQLANFMARQAEPGDDNWAELRDAQLHALSVPRTAMATAIDIGDAGDIHPANKKDVGARLALGALAIAYDQPVEWSGPVYKSAAIEGNKIRVRFTHTGKGLVSKGDSLKGFAVAGPDKKFVWAEATIDGDTIVVSSPQVTDPIAVRYAWASNPETSLYNRDGLPAVPFRTDDWPAVTKEAR